MFRSQNDQLTAERDKLKLDIAEANRQNTALVQEIDDRHANIEKTNETKLRYVLLQLKLDLLVFHQGHCRILLGRKSVQYPHIVSLLYLSGVCMWGPLHKTFTGENLR